MDKVKYIKDIYINDNKVYITSKDSEVHKNLYLRSKSKAIDLNFSKDHFSISKFIAENLEDILGEERYTLSFKENENSVKVYLRGFLNESAFLCKNIEVSIENDEKVYLDIKVEKGEIIFVIRRASEELDLIGKIKNANITNKKALVLIEIYEKKVNSIAMRGEGDSFRLLEKSKDNEYQELENYRERKTLIPFENVKSEKLNFLLKDSDLGKFKYEYKNIHKNLFALEIDLEELSNKDDGKFYLEIFIGVNRVHMDNKEKVKLKRIIEDNNKFRKEILLNINEDNMVITTSGKIKFKPILIDAYIKDEIGLSCSIDSNISLNLYENIEVELSLESRKENKVITRIVTLDERNNFIFTLKDFEIYELNNLYEKEWDIKCNLIVNNEIIESKKLFHSNPQLKGLLNKGRIKVEKYTFYTETYLTKNKKCLAIRFKPPIAIRKIVNIRLKKNQFIVRLRVDKDIRKNFKKLQVNIKDDKNIIKSKKTLLKGKKTLLVKYEIEGLQSFVDRICTKGIFFEYDFNREKFAKEFLDVDRDIIIKDFKDRIFKSKKYKGICKKLYKKLFLKLPLRDVVLFESFLGRNVSGNPKYIYEYMMENGFDKKYKLVWILNNIEEELVGPGTKIRRRGLKYYYYMATAKYWVFNTRQADEIVKRKGNTYLQTWHGTPLKRLALDMDNVNMAGQNNIEDYKEKFYKNSRRWDYLLAQNNYSRDIFKAAFAFEKPILDYGYPANDILYNKNNKEDIDKIKKKFNLPLDKKIILYAPTWRDNNFMKKGHYKMQMQLELDKLTKELGDEYIVLLRMHYLIMNSINIEDYKGLVYNFSQGYDIQELYLVSDILITDYSSVMFDYANLKRPILFFAYDIEDYRDSLRGFYFNFEEEAPGPIVKTTEEVIHVIENIDVVNREFKDKADKFYNKFCHIDRGNSAEKVVKEIFG